MFRMLRSSPHHPECAVDGNVLLMAKPLRWRAILIDDGVVVQQIFSSDRESNILDPSLYSRLRKQHFGTLISSGQREDQVTKKRNYGDAFPSSGEQEYAQDRWLQFTLEEAFYLSQEEVLFQVVSLQTQARGGNGHAHANTEPVLQPLTTAQLWSRCSKMKGVSL
jgi:hypothetical protein